MKVKKINHISLHNEWYDNEIYSKAETLVLGSFNPYNNDETKNADYYYGRSSNHLWKSVSRNNKLNEDYFCNNLDRKKTFMLNNLFCFYDVVDSLIISCDDDNSLDEYVNNKIFNNFLDQNVFKSKTRDYYPISIKRVYNQKVIELLNTGKIKKVIHTMGNNTITKGFETNPKENNEKIGFQKYIDFIKAICESRNITFVEESYSPSQYAIKTKKVEIKSLDKWISDNVLNK